LVIGALFGGGNRVSSWNDFAAGTSNFVDGKISGAIGNVNIATANDSLVAGNQNAVGRRMYPVSGQGVDDPGLGIGDRAYVVIADAEGDVSGHFPNAQQSTVYVSETYGAGATNVDGNVYAAGHSAPSDLTWAMHPYMIVKGSFDETAISLVKILKAAYTLGSGTKIYYDSTSSIYPTISYAFGSYSPVVYVNGIRGGNGTTAMGVLCSAYGFGAFAAGYQTRAWAEGSYAHGWQARATGLYSTAVGYQAVASAPYSTAIGRGIGVSGWHSYAVALNDQSGTDVTAPNVFVIMGGNAGIGLANPSYRLDVSGGGGFTARVYDQAAAGVTRCHVRAGAGQGMNALHEWQDNSGATLSSITSTGVFHGNLRVVSQAKPLDATAPGAPGDLAWDSNFIYLCVAVNVWVRAAMSSW
jgi:hypothetical protein